jgi:hypothetical protein
LAFSDPFARFLLGNTYLSLLLVFPIKLLNNNAWAQVVDILRTLDLKETIHLIALLGIFRDIPSRKSSICKALFTKFSLAGKCVEDKLKFIA